MDRLTMEDVITKRMTKGDLVEYYGFDSADVALPQMWLYEMANKLYQSPDWDKGDSEAYDFVRCQTLWVYGEGDCLGGPFFATEEAEEILRPLL
jgi:hypothetical protein